MLVHLSLRINKCGLKFGLNTVGITSIIRWSLVHDHLTQKAPISCVPGVFTERKTEIPQQEIYS